MWRLTVMSDRDERLVLPLVSAQYWVGRGEDACIRLPEQNVSRRHARLGRSGDGVTVEDTDSFNGTYVNAQRVAEPVLLAHGDVVQIADYLLVLEHVEPRDSGPARSRRFRPAHLLMLQDRSPEVPFGVRAAHLVGRRWATIGAASDSDIVVADGALGARHCAVRVRRDGQLDVLDLSSHDGTWRNGARMKRAVLRGGDELRLGRAATWFRFVPNEEVFRPPVAPSRFHALVYWATLLAFLAVLVILVWRILAMVGPVEAAEPRLEAWLPARACSHGAGELTPRFAGACPGCPLDPPQA